MSEILLFKLRRAIMLQDLDGIRKLAQQLKQQNFPALFQLITLIDAGHRSGDAIRNLIQYTTGKWLMSLWFNDKQKFMRILLAESYNEISTEKAVEGLTVHALRPLYDLSPLHLMLIGAVENTCDILQALSVKQLKLVLGVQDDQGVSPLHILVSLPNLSKQWFQFLEKLCAADLLSVLRLLDRHERTVLHTIAMSCNEESDICVTLHGEVLRKLIIAPDAYGQNPLHIAMGAGHGTQRSPLLLGLHSCGSVFEAHSMQDNVGFTPLHLAVVQNPLSENNAENLRMLSSIITQGELVEILKKTLNQSCCFHSSAYHAQPGDTILHSAVTAKDINFVKQLVQGIDQNSLFNVLQLQNTCGDTPMHYAAAYGTMLDYLISTVHEDDMKFLVKIQNNSGDTFLHIAFNLRKIQPQTDFPVGLRNEYSMASIDSSEGTHALVYYNTHNRDGAQTEAQLLADSFSKLGMDITVEEWQRFLGHEDSLTTKLSNRLESISSSSSLIVIGLMAHGRRGLLIDSYGLEGEITSLLELVTKKVPAEIPVVILIQACQNSTSKSQQHDSEDSFDVATDANEATSDEKNITLTRAHTVLLLSTVAEGVAHRKAFTEAISKQVALSDGKTDIHTMFTEAVKHMKTQGFKGQVPKFESTLDKSLCLPALCD